MFPKTINPAVTLPALAVAFAATAPLTACAQPPYTILAVETWVTAPNGNQVYTRIVQPHPALYPGERFPAIIAIPGGTGPGAPLADVPAYRNLASEGYVFVCFNPEGRGTGAPGNLLSQGAEDCNGFIHQDDLKVVIEYITSRTNVRADRIGVETSSFGVAIGAGALGRYPALPVGFLLDQEGPHDSRVITFYDVGHEVAVCGHLSTVTDPSPSNQAFWAEREAVRHIGGFRGMYLRMQAEVDHAQGPGYFRHTLEMNNAATRAHHGGTGLARWTRINGSDAGNPITTTYDVGNPAAYPAWISGRLADHPTLHFTYLRELVALLDAGDLDDDGQVDSGDAALWSACYTGPDTGPPPSGCIRADFDLDTDVDCTDAEQFTLAWTDASPPMTPAPCAASGVPAISTLGIATMTATLLFAAGFLLRRFPDRAGLTA